MRAGDGAGEVDVSDIYAETPASFNAENPMRGRAAGAPSAPDAAPRPSGGIELQEIARNKPWGERCLIKCDPSVSIKGTSRTGAKIADYEKDKGPGQYPYAAFVGDSLRASVLCDDAEAFCKCWQALVGDPNDPSQKLRVTRLKNKLGKGQEPFNFHLNAEFQSSLLADPLMIEIQIWITPIMALNDVSHAQYEVSRAKSVTAI